MKILVIGHHPDILALQEVMRDALPESVWLSSPDQTKVAELARAQDPDVILLDLPSTTIILHSQRQLKITSGAG